MMPPPSPPLAPQLPCTAVVGFACASPDQACYLDERCQCAYLNGGCAYLDDGAFEMDPHDGLGCNAGGHRRCRFCGFGAYASVECPETRVQVEMRVEGAVEGFDQTAFGERLAGFVSVPPAHVLVNVVPASILVTATIRMPSGGSTMPDAARDAQLTLILERLRSLNSTTATEILQVSVLSITPARITSTATDISSATQTTLDRATERATTPTGASSHALLAAVLAGSVLLLLGVGFGYACAKWRMRERSSKLQSKVDMFMIATSSQIVTSGSQKSDEPTVQYLSANGTSQEDGAEEVVLADLSDSFTVNPPGTPSQLTDDAYDSNGIEMTVTTERAAVRIARTREESEHLYV